MKRLTVAVAIVGALAAILVASRLQPPTEIRQETPRPVPMPGEGTCPPGAAASGLGPDMVRLPEGFCIDKTEVTRGQYEAWLKASPATAGQPGGCSSNADFTPTCAWEPGSNSEQPVVCVDWCDAQAFCKAAGKRLCGNAQGGGSYAFESYDDPKVSEWQAACSSGGQFEYTYGNTFDTNLCRDADADDYTTWGLADVGSFAECHSPVAAYAKVFDLSGHAAEWDNSCKGDGPDDACRIRGGSFQHHAHGTRCAMGRELEWPRSYKVDAVSFRCCAD